MVIRTGAVMSRPKFFTPKEVAAHNAPTDCWVSYLGKVYDLTSLCKEHTGWYKLQLALTWVYYDALIHRRCPFEAHSSQCW